MGVHLRNILKIRREVASFCGQGDLLQNVKPSEGPMPLQGREQGNPRIYCSLHHGFGWFTAKLPHPDGNPASVSLQVHCHRSKGQPQPEQASQDSKPQPRDFKLVAPEFGPSSPPSFVLRRWLPPNSIVAVGKHFAYLLIVV